MSNALKIKIWCQETISEAGWTLISMRAMPDLLLCNRKVSILHLTAKTVFDEDHVKAFNKYLKEVYDIEIPMTISGFAPSEKSKRGFKLEWIDSVTGRIKVSLFFKKPNHWFHDLFK